MKGESTCEAKDDQECGILVVSKGASSLGDIGVTLSAAQEGTTPLYTPGDKAETRAVCFVGKFRRLLSIWYWLPTILCQMKYLFCRSLSMVFSNFLGKHIGMKGFEM